MPLSVFENSANIFNNRKRILVVLLGVLFLVVIILVVFVLSGQKKEARREGDMTETQNVCAASTVVSQGSAEIQITESGEWQTIEAGDIFAEGSVVRTSEDSYILILFNGEDLALINSSSEVRLSVCTENRTIVEIDKGSVFNKVASKQGGSGYSVTNGLNTITALGTEFLVDIPAANEILVMIFESRVLLEYPNIHQEVEADNKVRFNSVTNKYESSLLTDPEKDMKASFVKIIDEASEQIIKQAEQIEEAKQGGAILSRKLPSATSSAVGGSTDSSSSSDNSDTSQGDSASPQKTETVAPVQTATPAPTVFGRYSGNSVESIVNSLQMVKDDSTGDFVTPPSGAPPSGVYSYSPIDIDNIYMGIRDNRIYAKVSLAGVIPNSRQTIGSDTIQGLSWNLIFDTDGNVNNGCFGSEKALAFNISYHDDGQIWYNVYGWSACQGGTYDGVSPNLSGTFHTYSSGIGKNSAVVSFSLSEIGINIGESLNIQAWGEAESNLWHHYSFDETSWASWTASSI